MMKSILSAALLAGSAAAAPLADAELEEWRATRASYDYTGIAQAYADYMIAHGRDVYGAKHTPLFVTGMDRKTGRQYVRLGGMPLESKNEERGYRTRGDPFSEDWPDVESMLEEAPALERSRFFRDGLCENKVLMRGGPRLLVLLPSP